MAGDVLLEKSQEGTVLQRLKPDSSSSNCGTAKQLTEKVALRRKTIPRRLKPDSFCTGYGTAEHAAEKVSDDTRTTLLSVQGMEQSYAGHEEFDAIKNQLAALMQGNLPAIPLWLKPDSQTLRSG